MAIRRRQNWQGQQRVDAPHLRSIESAISNDFDELLSGLILGSDNSYVVRGFEINMAGAIGSSANGLQLIVEDASFLHGSSLQSGTFYTIPVGTPAEILNSTTNEKIDGSFTPNTDNYVGIEFDRQVDDATVDQVYFWNPTTNVEFTKTIPLALTLNYKIVITTSNFASNILPIAVIQTDSSNNVISVTDRRPMLFRLGLAGSASPNPFYSYEWNNHTEGRTENFYTSTSSTSSPFKGGDKQIFNMKEFFDALMTEFKLLKGTPFWYSESSGGSIARLRQDIANTAFTGKGSISHDATTPGQINWNSDIFLNFIGGRLRYKIAQNDVSTNITLANNQVAYLNLVRGINITPNLVFTNGSPIVTSVGSVNWTADLQAGDFIKNASEGDEKYYEILSVDSLSQVTLTEAFQEISSGASGFDAQYAFGVYETNPAPSTDRHVQIADRGSVPFGEDYFWLFYRQDDTGSVPKVYVRILGGQELEQGEEQDISDNTSQDILNYIGSLSESDNDPNYATLATDVKTGTENYNSTQGENLTFRASKLTSMMADKAQDKTIQLVSNHTSVNNTTNGTAQEITFSGGSGTATAIIPSSTDNGTVGLSGTLSLEENEVAYYTIDRNAAFSVADLSALTVASTDSVPLSENIFVFAYRLTGTTVYLWNNQTLESGTSIALSVLRGYVQQNKTVKLIKGGTWSWNSVSNELINSASAYIQVAGLADNVNEIAAQTVTLDADGKCAYVTLKRTAGASVLAVSVADIASVPVDDHTFIIARRTGSDVVVGTSSFALKSEAFLELDGASAEINRYHEQLKVKPANPVSKRIRVSGSDVLKLDGSKLSLEQKNLLLSFDGAVIDFSTGEVFETDGVTPFLAGANDFTPFAIGLNEYFYYSVSVLPNTANPDNTISGQILVIPATASDAVLANAPKAPFPGSGLKLANVWVQEDGAGDILDIGYANITQLGVGGGGSGTGDANSDLTRYQDRLVLSPFSYANTNIASIDESDQLDGGSTASFDIPSGTFKFADSTAQVLLSTQQLDSLFLDEEKDLNTIEVYSIWELDNIDTAAVYEVSRDGGNNWQTVSASRIGQSDSYRGLHNFTNEPSNAFNQEYSVTNANALKDFDSSTSQGISQKFTVAATTVFKNVFTYINKNQVTAAGKFYVEIVRDDFGAPSTDVNDIVWTSPMQNISDLAVGNNVVNISSYFVMKAGDYHMNIYTDQEYKDTYNLDSADKISARINNAGPTPNLRTFNGTVWSSEVASDTVVYRLEGRVLDLRIRITSSATANDKLLRSYAIYYDFENGIEYSSPTFRELFSFDGTVDNFNEFTLTNFLPDSRLLMCFALGTGQVFRYGDFVLDGHKVVFPPNTFNVVGTVQLEFFQVQSVSGPSSTVADALLTANHLGSTDGSLDKSANGRGIILRNANGDLVEIGLDASNNLTFTIL